MVRGEKKDYLNRRLLIQSLKQKMFRQSSKSIFPHTTFIFIPERWVFKTMMFSWELWPLEIGASQLESKHKDLLGSRVRLFATPWVGAHQAPVPMEFSRQEYWSGLPFPSPGDCPNPWKEPRPLRSPALAGGFFMVWAIREALGN